MDRRARSRGVAFLGHRDDVDRLYSAMDVFVLASHREGFPRAAMEAAAMGLPVVATDIRGCRQVVDPGVTGSLVPVRDPSALAIGAPRLATIPTLRRRWATRHGPRADDQFDERRVVGRCARHVPGGGARKGVELPRM